MFKFACVLALAASTDGLRKRRRTEVARVASDSTGLTYYFDCDVPAGGDGSIASPFRGLSAISPSQLSGVSGISLYLKRGCEFGTETFTSLATDTFRDVDGFKMTAYGSGEMPVMLDSHMPKKAKCGEDQVRCFNNYAFALTGVSNVEVSQINFKNAPWYIMPADNQTASNFLFEDCVFSDVSNHGPLTFAFGGHWLGKNGKTIPMNYRFKNIMIRNCKFMRNYWHNIQVIGYYDATDVLGAPYTKNVTVRDSTFENTTGHQGSGILVFSGKKVLIENNVFNRLNGSGYWSVRVRDATVRNNFFANFARKHDACTNHVDIGNKNTLFHHNVGFQNEGGFLEVLGYSNSTQMKYSVSIDDGIDKVSNGLKDVFSFMSSGYPGPPRDNRPAKAGKDVYVSNNLMVSRNFQNFKFVDNPKQISFANNIMYSPVVARTKTSSPVEGYPDTKTDRVFSHNVVLGPHSSQSLSTWKSEFSSSPSNAARPDIGFDGVYTGLYEYMRQVMSMPLGRVTPTEIREGICNVLRKNSAAYNAAKAAAASTVPKAWGGDDDFASMGLGETDGQIEDFCGSESAFPLMGPMGDVYSKTCKAGITYEPVNMPGQGRTATSTAAGCQSRCASTRGCKSFAWWANGGCHIQDASSREVVGKATEAGSATCDFKPAVDRCHKWCSNHWGTKKCAWNECSECAGC